MIVKPSEAAPLSVLQFAELSLIAGRKSSQHCLYVRQSLTYGALQFLLEFSAYYQVTGKPSFLSWHHIPLSGRSISPYVGQLFIQYHSGQQDKHF